MSQDLRSKILLPLYIYPHPGAWNPFYTAVATFPDVQFLVIINPNSGPGTAPWWPNEDYVREIPRLNALPNVTTLGYVCITYCKRPVQDVLDDIESYDRRGREDSKYRVDGIFLDETVNLYSEEAKGYLDTVDRRAQVLAGVAKRRMIIHNPGTAVSTELANPGPEVTVVVETAYKEFVTEEYQEWLSTSPYERSRTAYMVHSVPLNEVGPLTRALRKRAAYLFLTSASCDFYGQFGENWSEFVASLAGP